MKRYQVLHSDTPQGIEAEINKHAVGAMKLHSLTVTPFMPPFATGVIYVAVLENTVNGAGR